MTAEEQRTTEQGNRIAVALIRDFLAAALAHDAVQDNVNDLLFAHVVEGRYHPSVIVESLRPMIEEILEVATGEDWRAVAAQLIAEVREVNGEAESKPG